MGSVLTLDIDAVCPLLNQWQRMHWRERKRFTEGLAWKIVAALRGSGWVRHETPPIEACCIQIERLVTTGVAPDWDGLAASGKPLLDTLVVATKRNPYGLGVIEDDNPKVVEAYQVWPGRAKQARTIVRIYHGEARSERFLADYEKHLRGTHERY